MKVFWKKCRISKSCPGEETGEQHFRKELIICKLKVSSGWSTEFLVGVVEGETRGEQELHCQQL